MYLGRSWVQLQGTLIRWCNPRVRQLFVDFSFVVWICGYTLKELSGVLVCLRNPWGWTHSIIEGLITWWYPKGTYIDKLTPWVWDELIEMHPSCGFEKGTRKLIDVWANKLFYWKWSYKTWRTLWISRRASSNSVANHQSHEGLQDPESTVCHLDVVRVGCKAKRSPTNKVLLWDLSESSPILHPTPKAQSEHVDQVG